MFFGGFSGHPPWNNLQTAAHRIYKVFKQQMLNKIAFQRPNGDGTVLKSQHLTLIDSQEAISYIDGMLSDAQSAYSDGRFEHQLAAANKNPTVVRHEIFISINAWIPGFVY